MTDFAKARRQRLLKTSSENTSPADCLGLAADYMEEQPEAGPVVVVIQRPEGGVTTFYADCTFAEAVYLLEGAKLSILLQSHDAGHD